MKSPTFRIRPAALLGVSSAFAALYLAIPAVGGTVIWCALPFIVFYAVPDQYRLPAAVITMFVLPLILYLLIPGDDALPMIVTAFVFSVPIWIGPIFLWKELYRSVQERRLRRESNFDETSFTTLESSEFAEPPAMQFRLKTIFLVMTASAVAFFFWRSGLSFLIYACTPPVVFCLSAKHNRWQLPVVSMIVVMFAATAHIYGSGEYFLPALILAIAGCLVAIPFWLIPMFFWQHFTDDTTWNEATGFGHATSRSDLIDVEPVRSTRDVELTPPVLDKKSR